MPLDVLDRWWLVGALRQAHTPSRQIQQAAVPQAVDDGELLADQDAAMFVESEGAIIEESMMQRAQQDAVVDGAWTVPPVHAYMRSVQSDMFAQHECAEIAERAPKLVCHGNDSLELRIARS